MWKDLSMGERAALIRIAVDSGVYSIDDIVNTYNSYAEGGPINPYSAGSLVDAIYRNSKKEEYLGEPSHHYDLTISKEEADRLGYYPDERGHRDDKVKKPSHPTHPSRGKWNSFEEFELTDKGMDDPNYTLFGLNDGGQDPQAVMTYKGGIVLPEITVTPEKKYIYNSYDNINIYANGGYKPSSSIRKRISNWEGSSMKTNRSFEAEARDFNASLPKGATSKLTQEQLDGLYSYSYNVGAGNFRKRVNPVLTRYLAGKATIQDVQRSMWASKDNQLGGLAKRRNAERAMLDNYTPMDFGPLSNTTTMMINHYLPETEPIEIPQLQFNDIINIPKSIELEPSTPYSSSDIDFSDPGSSLANALDIIQMIRHPRKINIYT